MFMPETEDMLPRAAPRPAAAVPVGHSEEIVKPTVPEVSILFGQQPPQQQQPQQRPQQQQQESAITFASWKKQLLPRVNFSPVLTTELGPAAQPQPVPPTAAGCNEYNNYLPRSRAFEVERPTPAGNSNLGYAINAPTSYTREAFPPSAQVIQSDVLTICAGTQTDNQTESVASRRDSLSPLLSELGNLASKGDLRELVAQLDMMRQEQQHLRRLCETLLQQHQQQQNDIKTFKETSTQCDILNGKTAIVKRTVPKVHDYIVEEEAEPYELPAKVSAPQFQSPRAVPPMAQSTGYRPNTPLSAKQSPATNNPVLNKPNTEKSLVMNELARKYLPQKQINELMDELRLSPTTAGNSAGIETTSPLRRIDNFHQSPSNISNASYVYLKKYRLLPEQRMPYEQVKSPVTAASPQGNNNQAMLDLDNIRNQPKLI